MGILQLAAPIVGLLLNSADKGAWPALQAATGKVKAGGYYGPTGFGGIGGRPVRRNMPPTPRTQLWQSASGTYRSR